MRVAWTIACSITAVVLLLGPQYWNVWLFSAGLLVLVVGLVPWMRDD